MSFISRGLRFGSLMKNLASSSSSQLICNGNIPTSTGLVHQNNLITKLYFATQPTSREAIDKMVKHNKVVIFMKGVPEQPRCGFSNAVVKILEMHGVQNYDSHDVLADEGLRQGIKEFSNWPTIPQVYINGEFVGGCDIMLEIHKSGELVGQLQKAGIKSALTEADEHKSKSDDTKKT